MQHFYLFIKSLFDSPLVWYNGHIHWIVSSSTTWSTLTVAHMPTLKSCSTASFTTLKFFLPCSRLVVGIQALPSAGWLIQVGWVQLEDVEKSRRVWTNVILDDISVCILWQTWFSILGWAPWVERQIIREFQLARTLPSPGMWSFPDPLVCGWWVHWRVNPSGCHPAKRKTVPVALTPELDTTEEGAETSLLL